MTQLGLNEFESARLTRETERKMCTRVTTLAVGWHQNSSDVDMGPFLFIQPNQPTSSQTKAYSYRAA